MGFSTGSIQDRWHQAAGAVSGSWLAWVVWALLVFGAVALVFAHQQIRRNRRLATEETRPPAGMLVERHAAESCRRVSGSN